jgi:hypothetical protein
MGLGLIQAVTEMRTKNIPGGKGQPACKADNLTDICEPIVYPSLSQPFFSLVPLD